MQKLWGKNGIIYYICPHIRGNIKGRDVHVPCMQPPPLPLPTPDPHPINGLTVGLTLTNGHSLTLSQNADDKTLVTIRASQHPELIGHARKTELKQIMKAL